jgi:hypothetical protein
MSKTFKVLIAVLALGFFGLPVLTSIAAALRPPAPADTAAEVETTQADPVAEYQAALDTIPSMATYVTRVRPGSNDRAVDIQVTDAFKRESQEVRQEFAVTLWKAWAVAAKIEPESARIKLVDRLGEQVGGSRAMSDEIYVDYK